MPAIRYAAGASLLALPVWFAAAIAAPAESKSLSRFHDPVVVATSNLHALAAPRGGTYRLFRVAGGRLEPIPFQLDERDDDGELTLREDREPLTFDDNDELVFMAKDTGDRVTAASLPNAREAAIEIEVTDPRNGNRGWVYLLRFAGDAPPPSPVRYARFDETTNRAEAALYVIDYFPGRNFFTGMRINEAAGGTGENILDRMKIRMNPTFFLLFTRWSPVFTEEDFSVSIDGIRNGPVRAIRRVRQTLDLGPLFPDLPSGTVYTYYYFSSFQTPSKFALPWLALKALRDFRFAGMSDFSSRVIGMTYWDSANPQGLRFTGGTGTAPNAAQDHEWWVVGGKGGTCLHAFLIPEKWKDWGVVRGTIFRDDSSAIDPEGSEAELGLHAAGYSLLNMTNLRKAGTYDLNLATFILPEPYAPGDEAEPLAMLHQPLRVSVRPVWP